MKVACITGFHYFGGAERQISGLAEALAAAGHDVEIITYNNASILCGMFPSGKVRHVALEDGGLSRLAGSLGIVGRLVRHLRNTRCDCVIAFLPGPSTKACLAHFLWPGFRLFVSERSFTRNVRLRDRIRMLFFREAEKIICNNYAQADLLKKYFPKSSDRILTVCNFVDLQRFCPAERCPEKVFRFAVTARVKPRKNPEGLIRAAAILKRSLSAEDPGFRIDWYGSAARGRYLRKCMNLIEREGLGGCFEFHDAVSDVAAVYHGCDAFCLPSFFEGTSNSLAEALACGLPVLCSAIGDNVRYVRGNGFLFDPSRPADIAKAMKQMLHERERAKEMGLESRALAERLLSPGRFVAEYLELVGE